MAIPVVIDTDMGIDDGVAIALALASDALAVNGVVGVGGVVDVDCAVGNIGRLLDALAPPEVPPVGRGLNLPSKTHVERSNALGADGLGDWEQPAAESLVVGSLRETYERAIDAGAGETRILALGPLTNLAALLGEAPSLFEGVRRIYVCGGAVWAGGGKKGEAEFNFRCDSAAAAAILDAGLPVTAAPLDVTGLVCLDQSHAAHMAASGYRTGEVAAALLERAIEDDAAPGYGKAFVPAAVAVGGLLWPDMFLKTRMRLEVDTSEKGAGRCKPALGGDKDKQIDLLTAVNAVDFLDNLLESLCHEAFIV